MNPAYPKHINLALQGGGSHGAFTWGVLDRLLDDRRIVIDSITGVSSGAMNTCVLAHGLAIGDVEQAKLGLENFWQAVANRYAEIFEIIPGGFWQKAAGLDYIQPVNTYFNLTQSFSPYQLNPFNLNPLRDILEEQIDFEVLRNQSNIKLYIGATNVRTGKMRIFTNKELSIDVLLASACLPSLHQTIEIEGESYWDGGYSGNPPLYPLIFASGNADILIVLLQPLLREKIPTTTEEIQQRSHDIMFTNTFLREMRAIALSKEEIKKDWLTTGSLDKTIDRIKIHIIEDEYFESLDSKTRYAASPSLVDDLYQRGCVTTDTWLVNNYQHIGQRSSVDLVEMFT